MNYIVRTMHNGLKDQIKQHRQRLKLSQAELAERMGKNVSWVKNAETRTRRIDPQDIHRLAQALELEVGELFAAS